MIEKYVKMILYGISQSIGREIFNILLKEVPGAQTNKRDYYRKIIISLNSENKTFILCQIKLETLHNRYITTFIAQFM